jgi:nucleotide-binding universal stress UspA family protein
MTGPTPRIVLAVGPDPIDSALVFAVDEARRTGRGLHLVHVVPDLVPAGSESVLMDRVDPMTIGRETLDLVADRARHLAGNDVPVTHELWQGRVVPALVDAVSDPDVTALLVLEHRPRGRWERIVTRSVAGGVAARTVVPIVSVPAGWRPEHDPPVVTVGVDRPDRAHAVLVAAFDAARARGAELRAVYAWDFPAAYDDLVTMAEHDRWVASSTAAVAGALAEVGGGSDLLVLGRHDPLLPFGSHLGSIARAVLHEATCPVLLVSPHG